MSKLNELFVDSINKAVLNAELVGDKYQKAMAYATTAQALAVYLKGRIESTPLLTGVAIESTATLEPITNTQEKASVEVEVAEESAKETNLQEEVLRLSEKNLAVVKAIDEAIASKQEWTLPIDENGIPYLNEEDHAIAERVMAYTNAMTPEIQEKKRKLEVTTGEAVLNETVMSSVEKATQVQESEPAEFTPEDLAELDAYKVSFNYDQDPVALNNLYHNFTDGVHASLEDLTPGTLNAFLLFIKKELATAFEKLEEWKASWITKEGLDALLCEAYGVDNATCEEYVHDGNVFWFNEYIELYNANAWLGSYVENTDKITLNSWVKSCFEDNSMTIDNINDENVVAFICYVQSLAEQTA